MKNIFLLLFLIFIFTNCTINKKNYTLFYNAKIYKVDNQFSIANAMVINDNKIVEVGDMYSLQNKYQYKELIDCKGKYIYPGFIDAHCHFLAYGLQLKNVNLVGTNSWLDIMQKMSLVKTSKKENEWIIGRGWDQNDWDLKSFPTNDLLNTMFPNNPVVLTRIDGHAAIINNKALELANIKPNQSIDGGVIETKNGKLTGILIDNAVSLVEQKIPVTKNEDKKEALINAQKNCFSVGLTTVDDCGLDFEDVDYINELQKQNILKMKMYILLSDANKNYNYLFTKGKIKTENLTVNGFKVYSDGALGSYGACLLKPYSDKNTETGFLLNTEKHFDSVANIIANHHFQMCTHAIGDSANRVILKTYAKYLKTNNNERWRIEHAQIINENDFSYFKNYNIIPSVQPTHATSDMNWAINRLGTERIKNAYAYQNLLQQNKWLPLGTDFPVEDISPFKTFYAAVVRKDSKGLPANGFEMNNALTRQQALNGMTIWAAKSNFEENEKGSLEKGKFADFIILDTDLMQCNEDEILNAKVLKTFINGKLVWENK